MKPNDIQRLMATYQPNAAVLRRLRRVHLVAVVGPTGVGKTTLINYAAAHDPGTHALITDVSRPPRSTEHDGVDYFFRSKDDILKDMRRGELVQFTWAVQGAIYASRASSYAADGRSIMAVAAHAMPVFRRLPFGTLQTICVIPSDFASWQQRIARHDFSPSELRERLQEARSSLQFVAADKQAILFVNAELQSSCELFVRLIQGEALSADYQRTSRKILERLLEHLGTER